MSQAREQTQRRLRDDRTMLAQTYRARADRLDGRASGAREAGDPAYAEDLEGAAADYREAADQLDYLPAIGGGRDAGR